MIVCKTSGRFIVNLGGTAEVQAFVPVMETKAFFIGHALYRPLHQKGALNMAKGRFGIHGGQYIPETLMNAVIELEESYNRYKNDPDFQQ